MPTFNITPNAIRTAVVLEVFSLFGAADALNISKDFTHAQIADACSVGLGTKLFFPVPQGLGHHPVQQSEHGQVGSPKETPLTSAIVPRFSFCACWPTIPRAVQDDLIDLAKRRREGSLEGQWVLTGMNLQDLEAEEGEWDERADMCGLVVLWVGGHAFGLRIKPAS